MPETVFLQVTHLELASSGMVLVVAIFIFLYPNYLKHMTRINHHYAVNWFCKKMVQILLKKTLYTSKSVLQSLRNYFEIFYSY